MDVSDILPFDDLYCARCKMPVYEFKFFVAGNEVTFLALCHGDSQLVTLTLEDFEEIRGIELGLAFTDP
jgi:hypothetical protein